MRPKWTRYVAMGIALLLAVVMLLALVVPYIGLYRDCRKTLRVFPTKGCSLLCA